MSLAQMGMAIVRDSAFLSAFNSAATWGTARILKWNPQSYMPAVLNAVIFKTVEFASWKIQNELVAQKIRKNEQQFKTIEDTQRIRKVSAFLGAVLATTLTPTIAKLFKATVSYKAALTFTLSSLALSAARYCREYRYI